MCLAFAFAYTRVYINHSPKTLIDVNDDSFIALCFIFLPFRSRTVIILSSTMSALILKAANQFSVVFLGTARSDDSTGDRVNYRYTCAILVAFILIVSNREFTNKRIQCWVN